MPIDLLHAKLGSTSLKETLAEAQRFLGNVPIAVSPAPARPRKVTPPGPSKRIASARKLFASGKPILGTAADAYLRKRGITRFGPALRYHPRVFLWSTDAGSERPQHRPALLAKITDSQGNVTGCARTYLDATTGKIADLDNPKRILGQLHGNAIRFWSGQDCADLIVGEGLENTLSIGTALPEFDVASCLTATHLGLFIPPVGIKRIWVARDNDEAGKRAAAHLAAKLAPIGISCWCVVPRLADFNEDLLAFGKDALRDALLLAMKEEG